MGAVDTTVVRFGAFVRNDVLRFATLVAIAAFLFDWATKSWALSTVHSSTLPLGALVLGVERNDAFAFSTGSGQLSPGVVIAIRLLALGAAIFISSRVCIRNRRLAAGFALLIGGGLGNLADVVFRGGAVVDFIGAGPFSFEWAGDTTHFGFVFNAADVAILIGLGLIAPQIQQWSLGIQQKLARWEERWLWSDVNA